METNNAPGTVRHNALPSSLRLVQHTIYRLPAMAATICFRPRARVLN